MVVANGVRFIRPEGAMGTLLEVARHALEGVEVLVALATTGLLGVGLIYSRNSAVHDPRQLDPESGRE